MTVACVTCSPLLAPNLGLAPQCASWLPAPRLSLCLSLPGLPHHAAAANPSQRSTIPAQSSSRQHYGHLLLGHTPLKMDSFELCLRKSALYYLKVRAPLETFCRDLVFLELDPGVYIFGLDTISDSNTVAAW